MIVLIDIQRILLMWNILSSLFHQSANELSADSLPASIGRHDEPSQVDATVTLIDLAERQQFSAAINQAVSVQRAPVHILVKGLCRKWVAKIRPSPEIDTSFSRKPRYQVTDIRFGCGS